MELFSPANSEIITPVVPIEFNEGTVALTWGNTRIRTFPDEMFNHTEFYDNDDELCATASRILLDTLFELDFPMLSLPYVDEHTMAWIMRMECVDLSSIEPETFNGE